MLAPALITNQPVVYFSATLVQRITRFYRENWPMKIVGVPALLVRGSAE